VGGAQRSSRPGELLRDISVYSGALGRWVPVTCRERASVVSSTEAGAEVRIPQSALAGYTQRMADAYAASHTVGGG
jgi:hypothetical protein